ncbi:hypothetical protein B0H17DRAFT_1288206 [Mycena rosella]|uniref:Dipeptidylpeptidase IV N-terminal domain-containing protein n=1 Tax=Mycena rosella TaxID=1033263 RepID=A0AAD7BMY7_MYCRO|nr:hypothetical protein B0H17DRAFT_1288206 [Mycena rosella]
MWNPYAQGGWTNTANPNAGSSGRSVPQPSIFGALPYPTPISSPTFLTFRFSSCSPTLLDSTVTGPKSRTFFRVKTDSPTPVVIIEWLKHPIVEIRNILSKRQTSHWLALSADKSYRTMSALGKTFVWAPDGKYICLYSAGLGAPQIYARVFREDGEVTLELTQEAVQIGLLELCVTAALLLQSGRNID